MQLYTPWALLLFLILPVMAYLMLRKKRSAAVRFPSLGDMTNCIVSWRLHFRPLLMIARLVCVCLLVVALARPRKGTVLSEVSTEGVAIEVVADRSSSMEAEMDYDGKKMTRLGVVKRVFADFIEGGKKGLGGRSSDLVGLITFAGYAETKCPLVHSHDVLIEFLNKTDTAKIRSEDGTAIGDAIALAAARLNKAEKEIQQRKKRLGVIEQGWEQENEFKIKSKVIILLTDGMNNAGQFDPLQAAQLAKQWGIKIYTIGIGSAQAYRTVQMMGQAYKMPVRQAFDERLLKKIAEETGGFYGRAANVKALRQIVKKIDEMEKTEVKSVQYTQFSERFGIWTLAALIALALEILAGCTIFRKIP